MQKLDDYPANEPVFASINIPANITAAILVGQTPYMLGYSRPKQAIFDVLHKFIFSASNLAVSYLRFFTYSGYEQPYMESRNYNFLVLDVTGL